MSTATSPTTAGASRKRLYEVMEDDSLPLDEKQRHALEIGVDVLGVENGHIERIRDADTHEITVSVGETTVVAPEGSVVDQATTYCRRTLEQDSPLAMANVPAAGWQSDPAYERHQLDCYLGTTVFVDGEPYGTVCFVSRDVRPTEFSADERMFIELLARLLGRAIESRHTRKQLTAQSTARQQSEAKYEALMDAAPAAIFVADVESGETVEVNQRATDLVGYTEDELLGMHQSKLHPPRQRERYEAELDRLLDTEEAVASFADGTPLCFLHEDGTEIPVEISSSLVEIDGRQYVQGLVRDISDRRQRREELRVKDRAMDEASVGISIADARREDFPIVYANQAFEELTGYEVDEVTGRNCRFLQGPETADETVSTIRRALREATTVTTELVNYRADGSPFWNQLTITPVHDEAGELTHFIGIQRDVTGRKRRERLLSLLNRILRHNLRNDMNVIMGYSDIVKEQADGEAGELAARIGRTASKLSTLSEKAQTIEELVRNRQEVRKRDVVPALERVKHQLSEAHPEATVEVRAPDEVSAGITNRFSEALYELGENAIVHGGPNPTVRFVVTPPAKDDGSVEIAVEDDGPGLPEHERRLLAGGQETPLEHGNSIGLWIVKWMVTDLGGRVRSRVSESGTTVTLEVPRFEEPSDRRKPALISVRPP